MRELSMHRFPKDRFPGDRGMVHYFIVDEETRNPVARIASRDSAIRLAGVLKPGFALVRTLVPRMMPPAPLPGLLKKTVSGVTGGTGEMF